MIVTQVINQHIINGILILQTILYNNEKNKKTCIEKYGTDNVFKYETIKEKIRQTNLEKYGVGNPSQSDEIKEKIKATNLEKYGVVHYSQTNEFWEKFKKSIRWKTYNKIYYQTTYELDFIKFCEKNNIIIEDHTPTFNYELNNKNHVYHPDFYIKDKKLIVEIKSYYWMKTLYEKNIKKKESVIKEGYNYILIMDKKYEDFYNIIKN